MTPGEIAGVMGGMAAIIAASGWIANLGLNQIQRRKLLAETTKAEMDLGTAKNLNAKTIFLSAGELIESLRQEVDRLAKRLTETEARVERFREAEDKCQDSLSDANLRILRLETVAGTQT